MKKNIINSSAIFLILTSALFTSCKKDDETEPMQSSSRQMVATPQPVPTPVAKDSIAPTITLVGGDAVISLQGSYIESGITVVDDHDVNIISTVSGIINVDLTGTYILTYTATDSAGNSASITRNILVVNDAENLTGLYVCTIAGSPAHQYTQNLVASSTINNRVTFSRFKDKVNENTVYAQVVGPSFNIPSQVTNTTPGLITVDGTGSISGTSLNISYSENITGTINNYTETLIKQ